MTTFSFNEKTAIVSGAGAGIGFEIARQLSLSGASVILNDMDGSLAAEAAGKIRAEGGACQAVPGDASNLEVIHKMVETAVREFGRLDLAIANAGITTYGRFLEYKPEHFQRLVAVNLQGSFFLAQASARQMVQQGTGGRILFISSVTGHQAHPNLAAYGMTKAALEMLAKSLGVELAPHGITVNAVAPGATLTERTLRTEPDYQATWSRLTPTGAASTPADIAHAALFLLSGQARQITGQSLVVDGGWTAVSPAPMGPDPTGT
ncbi:MAG: SDR family oxidoreductase [Phaeodactylibacter sp.]|nr:SDR family oxidoreductase [Phaeodactylibacter sp.]MCB9049259.1 SDR family oxidoreductase [Lewinellaceae bacterium]